MKSIEVTCPTCSGRALYAASNAFRPFCSERCRDIDLGAWASERFRVADAGQAVSDEVTPFESHDGNRDR
jgi:hypothetical protein